MNIKHFPNNTPTFAVVYNDSLAYLFDNVEHAISEFQYLNAITSDNNDTVIVYELVNATFTISIESSLGITEQSYSLDQYKKTLSYYRQYVEFGFTPTFTVNITPKTYN
jgi:hypothetical protein